MSPEYEAFLRSKEMSASKRGLTSLPVLAPHLFRYQRECVAFGLEAGSWACFLDTGLGKTACELEWAKHAAAASNGLALVLTPLAVARQIEREGKRWGYNVRVIREQSDAGPGINVCNYDRLDHIEPSEFGAVVLDESSILKAFSGKTTRSLIDAFSGHRFRMAATATPAPNDHTELAQHSEFLGVMNRDEMLVRWFVHDSADTKSWRLKGHAVEPFYDWMASWARMAQHPRDLGDDRKGFDLEPIQIHRHYVDDELPPDGTMFGISDVSATDMHRIKRATAGTRAAKVAEIVGSNREPWVVWCDTDYEADALISVIGCQDVAEVRGSDSIDHKESTLLGFVDGSVRVIVTKPSLAGHGLNWQHCSKVVFVGRSFSYESWYQAVRRCWRFGQKKRVDVHLIMASGEDSIGRVIDRKADDHEEMKMAMRDAMARAFGRASQVKIPYNPTYLGRTPEWLL